MARTCASALCVTIPDVTRPQIPHIPALSLRDPSPNRSRHRRAAWPGRVEEYGTRAGHGSYARCDARFAGRCREAARRGGPIPALPAAGVGAWYRCVRSYGAAEGREGGSRVRILVTGGSGFIGRYFHELLLP